MGSYTNKDGIFINFTRVQDVVQSKYNLSPRKQFCKTAVSSSQDKMQRKMYDDEFYQSLVDKREASYRTSSDGQTRLPNRDSVYKEVAAARFQACAMFLDTQ